MNNNVKVTKSVAYYLYMILFVAGVVISNYQQKSGVGAAFASLVQNPFV